LVLGSKIDGKLPENKQKFENHLVTISQLGILPLETWFS